MSAVICPKCGRVVCVRGRGQGALARGGDKIETVGRHTYVSGRRCEGSGLFAEPVRLAVLEREAEHARRRESEAEAKLKLAEAEVAKARAERDRVAKRIEKLRAGVIEIGARVAQLEAQERES